MAHDLMRDGESPVPLFNSALETGVRAAVVLDAVYPRAFDLAHLTWFDHLVVHSHDFGGPESLHPEIPQRTGELLVRRRLVEGGLGLMRRLHLIDSRVAATGVVFLAREEASAFVDSLRSRYGRGLRERALWLAQYLNQNESAIAELIEQRIGRWTVEFQGEAGPRSSFA